MSSAQARDIGDGKLADVRQRFADLQRMEAVLGSGVEQAPRPLRFDPWGYAVPAHRVLAADASMFANAFVSYCA